MATNFQKTDVNFCCFTTDDRFWLFNWIISPIFGIIQRQKLHCLTLKSLKRLQLHHLDMLNHLHSFKKANIIITDLLLKSPNSSKLFEVLSSIKLIFNILFSIGQKPTIRFGQPNANKHNWGYVSSGRVRSSKSGCFQLEVLFIYRQAVFIFRSSSFLMLSLFLRPS